MKHLRIKLGFLSFAIKAKLALALLLLTSTTMGQAAPEVGDLAPDFALQGSDGNAYSLSDFRNKTYVVIAFFPKAFTRG